MDESMKLSEIDFENTAVQLCHDLGLVDGKVCFEIKFALWKMYNEGITYGAIFAGSEFERQIMNNPKHQLRGYISSEGRVSNGEED